MCGSTVEPSVLLLLGSSSQWRTSAVDGGDTAARLRLQALHTVEITRANVASSIVRVQLLVYVVAQIVGAALGVMIANQMFALPAVTISTHVRSSQCVAGRDRRDLWLTPGHLRADAHRPRCRRAVCRRCLHHWRVLLHILDEFRQSRCDAGQDPVRHVRGHRPSVRGAIHPRPVRRSRARLRGDPCAVAAHGRSGPRPAQDTP
jgi:hypothetical protein